VGDIILTSKTVEEMVRRSTEFLQLCKVHNVVLKKSKSNLLRKNDISLLGFTVSKGKLRPAEKKMDQIQLALDKLKSQKELTALLASLNFYPMFSLRFNFYAQPLFDMLKLKKAVLMFTGRCWII
jgi:hypothetical protein